MTASRIRNLMRNTVAEVRWAQGATDGDVLGDVVAALRGHTTVAPDDVDLGHHLAAELDRLTGSTSPADPPGSPGVGGRDG